MSEAPSGGGASRPPRPGAWAAERTRHHSEFDPEETAAILADTSTSVSVVIPALDEQETVAGVVAAAREGARARLVHEIVVVDGGSGDETVARARQAGATVVIQSEVLPEVGARSGKGSALWRGLAATRGDVVVFLDADIRNADVRFVAGLVGALATDPSLVLVKACYDRDAGRVTELVARPLLSTFWAHLAGLAQPLAGEYAGRRSALEQVAFPAGYGVELALVIDLASRFGVERLAQVDLGVRVHEHQSLPALGRMSMEVLHAAGRRLVAEERLTGDLAEVLHQPTRAAGGGLDVAERDVRVRELPPLASL